MSSLIYSFGIGLSFAVGIFTGAFLCSLATRKGREGLNKSILEHNERVENRLAGYVEHSARIAIALESIARDPAEIDDRFIAKPKGGKS